MAAAAAEELLERGLEQLGYGPHGSLIDRLMIHLHELERWNGKVRLVSDADPSLVAVRHVLDSLVVRPVMEELLDLSVGTASRRHGTSGPPTGTNEAAGAGDRKLEAAGARPGREAGDSARRLRIVDVGSGGGFPGIPLSLVYPELQVLLVERKTKKAAFLRSMVGILGLRERVEVFEGDVRNVMDAGYPPFPLAVSRAFRPAAEAFALLEGLVTEEGGHVLIYGGTREKIETEIAGMHPRIIALQVPFLDGERNAVLF